MDNRGPRAVPADIENAFPVQYWFPLREERDNEGQIIPQNGPMPGEYWQMGGDARENSFGERSLIPAFNSGNLKVGLQLADGHTYIATAIPDATSTLGLLAIAVVVLFRIQRGVSAHRTA